MIQAIDGEEISEQAVKLAVFMVENNLSEIQVEYDGAGDSGSGQSRGIKETPTGFIKVPISQEIEDIALNIAYEITGADFNNDGCSGEGRFKIIEGRLNFQADHNVVFTDSRNETYDKDLLDTDKL